MRRRLVVFGVILALVAIAVGAWVWRRGATGKADPKLQALLRELDPELRPLFRHLYESQKRVEENFDRERAEKVIADVNAGRLPVSAQGVVDLLAKDAPMTCDGKAYVTESKNSGRMFLFLMFSGKGSNMIGRLYVPSGLHPSDISTDRHGDSMVSLRAADVGERTTAAETKVGAVIVKQESKNWYRVKHDLD